MPMTGSHSRFHPSSRHLLTDLAADEIRILVATDSHVGFVERDPIRKDDSWQSFDEVMGLAKTEDVRLNPT